MYGTVYVDHKTNYKLRIKYFYMKKKFKMLTVQNFELFLNINGAYILKLHAISSTIFNHSTVQTIKSLTTNR